MSNVERRIHRLSFGALESFITREHGPDPEVVKENVPSRSVLEQTDGRIARMCGYEHRMAAQRWRQCGWLSPLQADRAAHGLGVHPTAIWGPDYHADLDTDLIPDITYTPRTGQMR